MLKISKNRRICKNKIEFKLTVIFLSYLKYEYKLKKQNCQSETLTYNRCMCFMSFTIIVSSLCLVKFLVA